MGDVEIVVKVPEGVPKERIERAVRRELEEITIRRRIEEILKDSEITDDLAVRLGRMAKSGRRSEIDRLLGGRH